jgi:hypothetical protein
VHLQEAISCVDALDYESCVVQLHACGYNCGCPW